MVSVLVLHPGSMGGAVAAALTDVGHSVHWVTAGRSIATAERASAAGSIGHDSLAEALAEVDVVLSICPPDNAVQVAQDVAAAAQTTGRHPIYVDANAIAPITMSVIEASLTKAGCAVVDGGIIGFPPVTAGTTRLYISGETSEAASLFEGSRLECVAMEGGVGAASALKMAYAAWTKGSAALLLTIAATAEAHGVAADLYAEWDRSQPGLTERLARTAPHTALKAWRWQGEMQEIAATMAQHGLPAGFHLAASETWRRLADFKDADPNVPNDPETALDADTVLARLIQG